MTKLRGALQVCGTASDVGKSALVAGMCRLLARKGVRVAPFKSQNMALNSWVTADGAEIGRAQAFQAAACCVEPEALMNPILLKPTGDHTSQVIILGRPWKNMDAVTYHASKPQLKEMVLDSLSKLRAKFDVVICEGAGSPAEINLLDNDIVNLRLASMSNMPAVLVGDIDRGGVFASLYGTVELLPKELRDTVKGFIINKFRGDESLLGPALEEITRRTHIDFLGVVPYISGVDLDAEDSLSLPPEDSNLRDVSADDRRLIDIAVVKFPRISNFTDFDPLQAEPNVKLYYVTKPDSLQDMDMVILPGSKSTVDDLAWLRRSGIADALVKIAGQDRGPTILGVCGGYQMLGSEIFDGVEGTDDYVEALGLLPVRTIFSQSKTTRRRSGMATVLLEGRKEQTQVSGYEIRHGQPEEDGAAGFDGSPWLEFHDIYGDDSEGWAEPASGVYGTSLHGIMENDQLRVALLRAAAIRRSKIFVESGLEFSKLRQSRIDKLADAVGTALDTDCIEALISSAGEMNVADSGSGIGFAGSGAVVGTDRESGT